ncbi:hypothetical protein [Rossellomorea sp. LjRoot5]|uniref:hypothetical protein n=1 Tax=Rossellomorea sp. LjRoot5 TaxID=3342331 RepID=UPI003ECD24E5
MKRLPFDDTLTKLGDIYHYLTVVKLCFELKDGEKIFVEEYGDISKKYSEESYQAEVKHHTSKTYLSDRSPEIWNTLKNWVKSKNSIDEFKHLLLLTTSSIGEDSVFNNWDEKSVDERYTIIKNIGETKEEREKTFRPLYNEVMKIEKDELKNLLGKFCIVHSQPNVSEIKRSIITHLLVVPEDKYELFIDSLVGYVIRRPEQPPYSWEISKEEFKELVVNIRDKYTGEGLNLPDTYQDYMVDDYDSYQNKRFVKEIKRINFDKETNNAINDVWRKNNTIIEYFTDNYIFSKDLKAYKSELNTNLQYLKKEHQLNCIGEVDKRRILESKKYYLKSMQLPALGFGIVRNNWRFFQNGIIHEIVDDGNLYWYLEEEKDE